MTGIGVAATALALALGGGVGAATGVSDDVSDIRHALNRLAFGPRPDDVERVQAMGLAAWIDRQLAPPERIDASLDTRLPGLPPALPGTPQEMRRQARQAVTVLAQQRLLRAVYSERQLEEVLVDFWFNHFNVFAGKGRTAIFLPDYEREAIRPHVLGTFRDMLGATARHPAMLFYLDNWRNGRRGLNENYARELLELHTLGVDGGYTQQDVVAVARAFTGWTIGPDGFRFAAAAHDRQPKMVLGQALPAGRGMAEGERVLDILAAHPSTARHVATRLARRFVSDDPPASLVTKAADRFTRTGGDLREVVRTIVTSDEFFAAEARHAKVKTPLDFVVSAVRAGGGASVNANVMLRGLQQLGMPLYMCQPPTGYDDTADAWIAPAALVTRINLAPQLAGRQAGVAASPAFQRK